MAKKWCAKSGPDVRGAWWVRHTADFPCFPVPLATTERLAAWLGSGYFDQVRAREYRCAPGWRINSTTRECRCFWFPKGYGEFAVGNPGRRVKFKKGDLLIVPRETQFSLWYQAPQTGHFYCIYFRANLFNSLDVVKLLGFPMRIPSSPDAPFRTASLTCVREYAVQASGWQDAIRAEILKVLLYIIRHYGDRFQPLEYLDANPQFKRLRPALDLIERQLDNPQLSVHYIAREIDLSPTYLRNLFQAVFKRTPHKFIQRRRIDKACDLLRSGKKPIKAIAQATGFPELSSFYRAFRQMTQNTPAQFRVEETTA